MSEDFLTIAKEHECQTCSITWTGTPSEFCSECKIDDLERQFKQAREDIETYKYDFETLVSILHDCLHNMSQEECLDTLRQVDEHYEHLKEKGESED